MPNADVQDQRGIQLQLVENIVKRGNVNSSRLLKEEFCREAKGRVGEEKEEWRPSHNLINPL